MSRSVTISNRVCLLSLAAMILAVAGSPLAAGDAKAQMEKLAAIPEEPDPELMSSAYWDLWNPQVQARIDKDIDQHRKANAILKIEGMPAGGEVQVEQISHDFIFGSHIFNFNQLGTVERNQKYKELFGTLFNSATIAFYWEPFEMQPNRLRFREEYWDTEEYWNQVKEPELETHWRRPATDPVVEFCESKGIRMHGHPIIWSARRFHPKWMFERFCPDEEKDKLNKLGHKGLMNMTNAQIEELIPIYSKEIRRLFEKRIVELSKYYGNRVQSWDVVNESWRDFHFHKTSVTGDGVSYARRGLLMPGDYTYTAFKTAGRVFPKDVLLNINDNVYWNTDHYNHYVNQIKDLIAHGCRIDIIGSQMHLFNHQQILDIADGKHIKTPDIVWEKMKKLSELERPIHISEVTIIAPGDDSRAFEKQAVIAKNLYRMWFSIENMMGITWWNPVDGGHEPGRYQISTAGLFTRDMKPKPSFYALDNLINHEWKTNKTLKSNEDGVVMFKGFKGRYQVSWKDKAGIQQHAEFHLKKDGDGIYCLP